MRGTPKSEVPRVACRGGFRRTLGDADGGATVVSRQVYPSYSNLSRVRDHFPHAEFFHTFDSLFDAVGAAPLTQRMLRILGPPVRTDVPVPRHGLVSKTIPVTHPSPSADLGFGSSVVLPVLIVAGKVALRLVPVGEGLFQALGAGLDRGLLDGSLG